MMRQDFSFAISLFNSKSDNQPKRQTISWCEFCDRVTTPKIRTMKDGQLFSPARFKAKRCKEGVIELSAIVFDFDKGEPTFDDAVARWKANGYTFAAYTTHSHQRITPEHPEAVDRFRLVIPLATPIAARDYPALWAWFAAQEPTIDRACKDASRMFYTPVKASPTALYQFALHDGKIFDWLQLDLSQPVEPVAIQKPVTNRTQGLDKYAQTALENEARAIASAANGTRNNTLNQAAYSLGQLVAADVILEWDAVSKLTEAGRYVGLSDDEIRSTIKSGIEAGKREPRTLPESQAIKTTLENKALQSAPDDWQDPQPLPDGLRAVPTLPESLLPSPLRGWLADITDRLQTPLEFAAVPALVALASVVGNQVRIAPKRRDDWRVVPNLWGAIIGRPGVMKSPAIAEAIKPLQRLVLQAQKEHAAAGQDWEFTKATIEAQKKAVKAKLEQAAKKGQGLDALRSEWDISEDSEPIEKRYIVNDSSVEKLGELLNQNPNGLLMYRDELTGWLRSLDDERRPNDRAFFLEAWNGDGRYTYDRIGRGKIDIATVTLSIIGGIQPDIFAGYLRGALDCGEANDGLIQRFQLMVYPDCPKEWSYIDRWPETEAKNKAFAIHERLSQLDGQNIGASFDDDGKPFLRFADEAQEFFVEWFTDLNQSLRSGEHEHPALEAHFSKYKSLMPSLALLFHLCEATGDVSLQAAEMAAAWCSFLEKHALRIYGLGISAAAINAKTLAAHLQKGDLPDGFTARDVYVGKGWAGLTKPQPTREALELLEDLHWLRSFELPTGGKPKTVYTVNPKVRATP